MSRLAGRCVLVTGAAGGIGAAIAARIEEDGAEVVRSDIDIHPPGIRCDVRDRKAVDDLVAGAGPLWAPSTRLPSAAVLVPSRT